MRATTETIHLKGDESLLIILMGALGDLVRGFCLPAQIKSRYPDVHITWLVEPRWCDLVAHHDQIDTMLVFDRPRGLKALPELKRRLRRSAFDITLDLQRHFKSGVFAYLSGSPQRLGFHPRNAKEFNWLFNNRYIPFYDECRSKLQQYLQFNALLGIDIARPLDFGLSAAAAAPLPLSLPPAYIVMVMGSSWATKNWHAEGYRQLLAWVLKTTAMGVVLVGDRSQKHTARKVRDGFESNRLVDLTGRTSLLELTAILGRAAAGIGPDSGPGHLAAAVGAPYVTLFGPTPPERVVPYRCEDLAVLSDTPCAGCYRKQCPYPECTCMTAITPEKVAAQLEKALALQAPALRSSYFETSRSSKKR